MKKFLVGLATVLCGIGVGGIILSVLIAIAGAPVEPVQALLFLSALTAAVGGIMGDALEGRR